MQPERIHKLNERRVESGGAYVLYWMQAAQRTTDNPALEYAVDWADQLGLPLVVGFALHADYPGANTRHFAFMLQGLSETARELTERRIAFVLQHGKPGDVITKLAAKASLVVVDVGYLRHQRAWRSELATRLAIPVVAVEGEVCVPVTAASNRLEYAAYTLRPKLTPLIDHFLSLPEERKPIVHADSLDLPGETVGKTSDDWRILLDKLDCRTGIPLVTRYNPGGTREGLRRLFSFIDKNLADYGGLRNDPAVDRQSGISPYLHFGQLAPVRVAVEIKRVGGPGADAFLEQLIVRRELAVNRCVYNHDYDTYAGLPDWARKTLDEHAADPRPHTYTPDELTSAATRDQYWNAAQLELLLTGKMHGYMRMYWGKKILEWSAAPAAALQTIIDLNDAYSLDGRDPNGYAGAAWCLGAHDSPWPERPIFGKTRYMNNRGLERKFDIAAYIDRICVLDL